MRNMNNTGVAITHSQSSAAVNPPSRRDVYRMFDRIARRYDFLNRTFSFGQDIIWRKKVAMLLAQNKSETVLDLATGTADVLLTVFQQNKYIRLGLGIDMSHAMLEIGRRKIAKKKLSEQTVLIKADALTLPIADNSFAATTIAFGIRNVSDVAEALKEMHRVIKAGGKSFILEFALPSNTIMRRLFLVYLRYFIPLVGGLLSGNKAAYRYLNETVETFPCGPKFALLMENAGFKNVKIYPLTFGVAMIYEGTK